MVQVFGGGHICDALAVVGKAASAKVAVLGHTLKRPRIVDMVIDPGKKHFNASSCTAQACVERNIFCLEHLEDFQIEFVYIQLEPALDGFWLIGLLDILSNFFKAFFDLLVSLPDDLLIVAEQLCDFLEVLRGNIDP